jgi:hypothetical protein
MVLCFFCFFLSISARHAHARMHAPPRLHLCTSSIREYDEVEPRPPVMIAICADDDGRDHPVGFGFMQQKPKPKPTAAEKLTVLFQQGAKMVPLVPRTVNDDRRWRSMRGWGLNLGEIDKFFAVQALGYTEEVWDAENSHVHRFMDHGRLQGLNVRFVARVISHHWPGAPAMGPLRWDDMEADAQQALATLGWCRWTHGELLRFADEQHPGRAPLTDAVALDIATQYMRIAQCVDVPDNVGTFLQGCRFDHDMLATRIAGQHRDFLWVVPLLFAHSSEARRCGCEHCRWLVPSRGVCVDGGRSVNKSNACCVVLCQCFFLLLRAKCFTLAIVVFLQTHNKQTNKQTNKHTVSGTALALRLSTCRCGRVTPSSRFCA